MLPVRLSPHLKKLCQDLTTVGSGTPFTELVMASVRGLGSDHGNIADVLSAIMLAERMRAVLHAGLIDSDAFRQTYDSAALPLWTHPAMDADETLQRMMGLKLLNLVKDDSSAQVRVTVGPGSDVIAGAIVANLSDRGVAFHLDPWDADFQRLLIANATDDGIAGYASFRTDLLKDVTNDVVALPNTFPKERIAGNKDKAALFAKHMAPYREKSRSGNIPFTLTYYPTEEDAALDNIPIADYLRLYFDMSDQPDDLIGEAHLHLISRLNKTENLRITNDDGTDVTMSLVGEDGRHFTFCNSLTFRNVPGSEVFSAPRRDSVNGTIAAKGKFSVKGTAGDIITDLTMIFENGRLIDFSAVDGAEHFEAFLNRNPGNRYIGEIGIGTNPHLKRHVLNGLFVEKVGGSFHVALGAAYTMTDYLGTPVTVDNGNRSHDHWDITTMLYGRGGRMFLDGDCIMEDGVFLDPALDILNRGWAAVPVERRPARWKNYIGPFTGKEDAR